MQQSRFEVVRGGFVAVWGISTDGPGEFYSGFPGKYNNYNGNGNHLRITIPAISISQKMTENPKQSRNLPW